MISHIILAAGLHNGWANKPEKGPRGGYKQCITDLADAKEEIQSLEDNAVLLQDLVASLNEKVGLLDEQIVSLGTEVTSLGEQVVSLNISLEACENKPMPTPMPSPTPQITPPTAPPVVKISLMNKELKRILNRAKRGNRSKYLVPKMLRNVQSTLNRAGVVLE